MDRDVLNFFVHHRRAWLTSVVQAVTWLGSSSVLIPLVVIAGLAWRAARRSWSALVLLSGAYAGAEVLFQILKAVIGRARPPAALAIGHFTGLAFPSGHATLSAAVWGMGAALIARAAPGARRAWWEGVAWAGAVLITLLVGLSRLYLGAHWLTDVLAGWVLGAAWLTTVLLLSRRWPVSRAGSSSRPASPEPERASTAASRP